MKVYGLQSNDLKNLGQDRAVEFFRRLLWNEGSRVGIGKNLIDVPDCINVGDGGLDSIVRDAASSSDEIIPPGLSGFQIKSSDLPPGDCKKELHQNKNLQNPIKPEIHRLLDNHGTYILVLFGDITPRMKRRREEAIREELVRMGYVDPKIRVYTTNQIMGFAERFPSLVAWLKGYPYECLPYQKWANNRDVSSPKVFIEDEQRENIINEIREKLRDSERQHTPIFRITGLSGLGKTRLVFETLSPDDLQSRVIYVRAESFKNSTLFNTILIDDNLEAIIAIDECSLEDHELFLRHFSKRGPRLALITISHEPSKVSTPALHYLLGRLPEKGTERLLSEEASGLPQEIMKRLANFADGYPRIAMLLAQNYLSGLSSREDILTVNDEALINRLIAGRLPPGSDRFRKTKLVLMGLSLFEKVGFKGEVSSEAKWVANLVRVDWGEFQEVVGEQKQRGIIQGEYYIYVTPFLLAVHLLREWWKTYGNSTNLEDLIKSIPKDFRLDMFNRFTSRFPFITSAEPGRNLVKQLLSKEGVFADGSFLRTEIGAKFFSRLTEADPELALNCLKRTIGSWSKEQLLQFKTGRREIVWALEKIAVWREFFADAARLLLALGEAENETYANNASGVFADLFSPAWGLVSPTEASPQERFPLIIEAIDSNSIERKRLGLRALRRALQWGHFTRMVGAEYQGARAPPKLWTPKAPREILDHYKRVWTYLEENLGRFHDEIRDEALKILLESTRGIARIHPSLSEIGRKTIRKMASYSWVDKTKLIETVSPIIHYDGEKMQEDVLKDWATLRDELTGSSFSQLLKRFVGMELLEDYFHNSEHYDTKWVESKIYELAEEVMENPNLLGPEYSWLTTDRAKRGYQFGYSLGKLDIEFSLLERLIEEQKKAAPNGSIYFLSGYFRALFEREVSLWENNLDALSKDESLKRHVPELTWRSGITDSAVERILSMAEKGDIGIDSFGIFRFGRVVEQISEPIFVDFINLLLKEPTGFGAEIALGLFHSYYSKSDRTLNKDLALNVLLHPVFWDKAKGLPRDQTQYHWKEIASLLIDQFPESGDLLAWQIIKFFGNERSLAGGFRSQLHEMLLEIGKRNPQNIWAKITEYLGPPIDKRAFHLTRWLRGEKGLASRRGSFEIFSPEDVWKWVDEDKEFRARYLATFVPAYLFHSEEKICLAREMLVKYGDQEDVRNNFSANYSTEGWTGSASNHFMAKEKELSEFKENETNANVIRWIEEYTEELRKDAERAKIREDRGF